MSRPKAQRLLSELLTLFDGPPSLAVESLIALLAGGNVLLSPRGHHFENLANAVAWSFNGVIRKIPPSAALDAEALSEGQQLAHVLLVEGVDTARLVKLRAVLRRLATADGGPLEPLFILATADPDAIPPLGHADRPVWDELFTMRLNGRDTAPREPAAFELEPDPLGIDQILPEDVVSLRKTISELPVPPPLASALEQMPEVLTRDGWPSLPARASADLCAAARVVAFLRGKREVNLSHVADALHPVLSGRLSPDEALPAGLLDGVEEAWDEVARTAAPGRQHAPQRKTFVGGMADLARASQGGSVGARDLSEVGTDPLVAPAKRPAVEEPQPIHDAYYAAPPAYKAPRPAPEAPDVEELEAPEAAEAEGSLMFGAGSARSPKARRRKGLGSRAVSVALLAAIVVVGTMVFPGWPAQLRGLYWTAVAQVQLWRGDYEQAGAAASSALELLGPRHVLGARLETIAFYAHHELRERERLDRERQAREASQAGRFEEAASLYEKLGQDFPDQPLYGQLAREARKRIEPSP
jgi:tetratricopeptide (TPR) repeat protein